MGVTATGFKPKEANTNKGVKGPHIFESTNTEFYSSLDAGINKNKITEQEYETKIVKRDEAPPQENPQEIFAKPTEEYPSEIYGTLEYNRDFN